MNISTLDWIIIATTLLISLIIGIVVAGRSGKNSSEYFLSGRAMPWWLLGISMVATTFSADTPNLVTDIVRKNGVSGNWVWWAFLLTGMLTVFVYARLWRRAGVFTDLEFYELRYSGKAASFLRGFRAIYLGVFFNVMIMATVNLAAIKIGGVLLGATPVQVLLVTSIVTVIYTVMGGLRAVILTDLFQFVLAMVGTILAAYYIIDLPQIGSLENLLSHESVLPKKAFLPDFSDMSTLVPLFILPLAVQWWSVWYPGAEPGGGGYIAQRMLSAKDENNALGATLLFNFAHYALRPWPWILIALASLIMFPDLASLKAAFPEVDSQFINDDLAYSAMLTYLPSGLLGLVIGSLAAALMSTISTHLNWGSSYIVHDFYSRFIDDEASERKKVMIGRLTTVVLLVLAAVIALFLSNALQAFNILLQIGAGTGLLFILRWFWWRINPWSEISAMVFSFVIACIFEFSTLSELASHVKLLSGVAITTLVWITVTLVTKPVEKDTLINFCKLVRPYHYGWKKIWQPTSQSPGSLGTDIGRMVLGTFMIYLILFGTGYVLYSNWMAAIISLTGTVLCGYILWRSLKTESLAD
jgi:Na+/proline symporter